MPKLPDVAGVIQREHDALIAETRIAQCPPFVAVNSMDVVAWYPSSLRRDHPATIAALSQSKGRAFIVDCPSLKSTCLWVRTDNDTYREDYLHFLNAAYQLEIARIPAPYDVDHLYNRSRAKIYALEFIRLALVSGPANRSHGAAYEKDITQNEAARVRKEMKLMDEVSMMKYFGYLSPLRDNPRKGEVRAYASFAASKMGLEAAEIVKSVQYLREKASTPWARK
jgi:hypothetical protein